MQDIPLILAKEQLEDAERLGLLCRDEVLDAVTFYPNFFAYLWKANVQI